MGIYFVPGVNVRYLVCHVLFLAELLNNILSHELQYPPPLLVRVHTVFIAVYKTT